jgi:serine/threonine protein kinase
MCVGIVHRDLKSLNLLLDAKWNVKVSDFGLTKFKEDVKSTQSNVAGTVHWTAPEVLNESGQADLILADVYAFGIILWELLTRQQPYFGMRYAATSLLSIVCRMCEHALSLRCSSLCGLMWLRGSTVRQRWPCRLSEMASDLHCPMTMMKARARRARSSTRS